MIRILLDCEGLLGKIEVHRAGSRHCFRQDNQESLAVFTRDAEDGLGSEVAGDLASWLSREEQ